MPSSADGETEALRGIPPDEYREISGIEWASTHKAKHSSSEFRPCGCVALGKLLHLSVPQHLL